MLPITVKSEDGQAVSHPTGEELTALVARIGGPGDRFLVVERVPHEPEDFIQTWHEAGEPYRVEWRDGGPDYHYAATAESPEQVAALFLGWQRIDEGWDTGFDWELVQFDEEPRPELEPGSGPARLATAFAALNASGITARAEFACCNRCGMAEIGGEAAKGDRGFVFSYQDIGGHSGAPATGGEDAGFREYLAYGTYSDSGTDDDSAAPARTVAVAQEVVAALTEAGLRTEWDGSPDRAIWVTTAP